MFDIIYVDGDHTRAGTLMDSLMCWPILREGGVLIWDDYLWGQELPAADRPQEAVDWFLVQHAKNIEVLHRGYQIAVRKI